MRQTGTGRQASPSGEAKPAAMRTLRALCLVALTVGTMFPAGAATVAVQSERTGSADWVRFDVVRYHFEFDEQRSTALALDPTSVDLQNTPSGEARAWIELCEDETDTACVQGQTWAGSFGAAITNGASIEADPLLQQVAFRGWLRDVVTDEPCEFFVGWSATGDGSPDLVPSSDPPGGSATLTRTAAVSVDARCWQTGSEDPAFRAGTGVVRSSIAAAIG